jgi:hypothetical protein
MSELACFLSKFLDTDDLDKQAQDDADILPHYLGCYPANVKPKGIAERCCWIWNVDEKDKPGTRWVAVVKEGPIIYFFDSYGKTPYWFKRHYWEKYFEKLNCKMELYNTSQIQSHISRTCGSWCLLFLKTYYTKTHIIRSSIFTHKIEDLMQNEQQLQKTCYTVFPTLKKLYERKCKNSKGQICKSYVEMYQIVKTKK